MVRNFTYRTDDPAIMRVLLEWTQAGRKVATARPLSSWRTPLTPWDDVPYAVGQEAVLRDLDGTAQLRVRFTDIYETTLATIPDRLWRDEGEPDADTFRAAHLQVWAPLGIADDTPLMAIHF